MRAESAALRIGLLAASLTFFDIGIGVWHGGQAFLSPLNLGLSFAAWAAGAFTGVLALAAAVHRRAAWLLPISFAALACQVFYVTALNDSPLTTFRTDNEMIGGYALEALKHGQNPYSWNFSDIVRVYRDPGLLLTPFLDGSYQHRLTYPALPILSLWAFDLVGLGQGRIVNLIALIALAFLLFLGAPRRASPIILLPLLAFKDFTHIALGGAQDIVWCALLVGMILAWRRPVLRAVLFGLAISFRQQPWFIAPFLIIALWNEHASLGARLREIGRFVGISAGLFLGINLPFMLDDFRGWWRGALEPAYAAFNVYSHGLGILAAYGAAPFPREFYTILQASFLACALLLAWRHPRAVGQAYWIAPGLFFWLFYRGLLNYWIFWLPPLLIAATRIQLTSARAAAQRPYRLATAALVLLIGGMDGLLAVHYLTRPPAIGVEVIEPLWTGYGGGFVDEFEVRVTNSSRGVVRPRFALQHDPARQALPWTILSGPESLRPGESGRYVITARDLPSRGFPAGRAAQLVVSDADGDYSLRAVETIGNPIPPRPDANDPDRIANPDYRYWSAVTGTPQGWSLSAPESNSLSLSLKTVGGRKALSLEIGRLPDPLETLESEPTRLWQMVVFPRMFSLWVYPTAAVSETLDEQYGLEIDDGTRRLRILFGAAQSSHSLLRPDDALVYVSAPLNRWSRQTIDLARLYAEFNWPLPRYSPRDWNGVPYPARQLRLSLIGASRTRLEAAWIFGAIEQERPFASPQSAIAEALAHPDVYYANLGDQYRDQGNDDLARGAYLRALGYNPNNADAYVGLGASEAALGNREAALQAFEKALALGYSRPQELLAQIRLLSPNTR